MFNVENLDFETDMENISVLFDKSTSPCNESKKTSRNDIFRTPLRDDSMRTKISLPGILTPDRIAGKSVVKAVKRKFPGPAGLLPDKAPRSFNDTSLIMENSENAEEPILCSQASASIFIEPSYKKLRKDLDMDVPDCNLNVFTVDWVKKKALGGNLKFNKIPFLAVILQSIDCTSADPVVKLRDQTGEIMGAIERESWKKLGDQIKPGASIALKEIGVLRTGVSSEEIVLTLWMNNFLTVYNPSEDGGIKITSLCPTWSEEIARSVVHWHAKAAQQLPPALTRKSDLFPSAPIPPPSLFKTVANSHVKITHHGPTRSHSTPKPFRPNTRRNNFEALPALTTTKTTGSDVIVESENESSCNFDLFLDDAIFDDLEEIVMTGPNNNSATLPPKASREEQIKSPQVNVNNQPASQFFNGIINKTSALFQKEASIIDEELSGIYFDDF